METETDMETEAEMETEMDIKREMTWKWEQILSTHRHELGHRIGELGIGNWGSAIPTALHGLPLTYHSAISNGAIYF
jgi:predicted Zn-dependent protease